MAHGYMREFDEGYDRGEGQGRDWSANESRRGNWRGRSDSPDRNPDQDRSFMFDRDGNRYAPQERQRLEGGRASEDNGDWPQSRSRGGRFATQSARASQERYGERHRQDFRERRGTDEAGFSSHPDDHYRSWRQQQIDALDRDYADYCGERERQFHHDFDSWRQNRQSNRESSAQTAEGELELTHERALGEEGNTPSPMSEATLGTNNSENSFTGRNRRSS